MMQLLLTLIFLPLITSSSQTTSPVFKPRTRPSAIIASHLSTSSQVSTSSTSLYSIPPSSPPPHIILPLRQSHPVPKSMPKSKRPKKRSQMRGSSSRARLPEIPNSSSQQCTDMLAPVIMERSTSAPVVTSTKHASKVSPKPCLSPISPRLSSSLNRTRRKLPTTPALHRTRSSSVGSVRRNPSKMHSKTLKVKSPSRHTYSTTQQPSHSTTSSRSTDVFAGLGTIQSMLNDIAREPSRQFTPPSHKPSHHIPGSEGRQSEGTIGISKSQQRLNRERRSLALPKASLMEKTKETRRHPSGKKRTRSFDGEEDRRYLRTFA